MLERAIAAVKKFLTNIFGAPVNATGATEGQVLTFTGGSWSAQDAGGGGGLPRTLLVGSGQDYTTFTSAMAAAVSGDTIKEVDGGSYTESFTWKAGVRIEAEKATLTGLITTAGGGIGTYQGRFFQLTCPVISTQGLLSHTSGTARFDLVVQRGVDSLLRSGGTCINLTGAVEGRIIFESWTRASSATPLFTANVGSGSLYLKLGNPIQGTTSVVQETLLFTTATDVTLDIGTGIVDPYYSGGSVYGFATAEGSARLRIVGGEIRAQGGFMFRTANTARINCQLSYADGWTAKDQVFSTTEPSIVWPEGERLGVFTVGAVNAFQANLAHYWEMDFLGETTPGTSDDQVGAADLVELFSSTWDRQLNGPNAQRLFTASNRGRFAPGIRATNSSGCETAAALGSALSGDFTVVHWLKCQDDTNNNATGWHLSDPAKAITNFFYSVYTEASVERFGTRKNNNTQEHDVWNTEPWRDWICVTLTRDVSAQESRMYVNGVLVSTVTGTAEDEDFSTAFFQMGRLRYSGFTQGTNNYNASKTYVYDAYITDEDFHREIARRF